MPPRFSHPPEVRSSAIRLHIEGFSDAEIARRLNVPKPTVQSWIKRNGIAKIVRDDHPLLSAGPIVGYERSQDYIGNLVYDTAVATLNALRARAEATSDPEWIKAQSAEHLAELDAVQGNWLIRILSAFRAAAEGNASAEDGAGPADAEPGFVGDRAVDPAD